MRRNYNEIRHSHDFAYIDKYMGRNGKWVYVYPDDLVKKGARVAGKIGRGARDVAGRAYNAAKPVASKYYKQAANRASQALDNTARFGTHTTSDGKKHLVFAKKNVHKEIEDNAAKRKALLAENAKQKNNLKTAKNMSTGKISGGREEDDRVARSTKLSKDLVKKNTQEAETRRRVGDSMILNNAPVEKIKKTVKAYKNHRINEKVRKQRNKNANKGYDANKKNSGLNDKQWAKERRQDTVNRVAGKVSHKIDNVTSSISSRLTANKKEREKKQLQKERRKRDAGRFPELPSKKTSFFDRFTKKKGK